MSIYSPGATVAAIAGAPVAAIDWSVAVVEPIIATVTIGVVAIALLLIAVWVMEKLSPFSLHKEIEEDHNVSAAIVIGSIVIGISLVIAAVAGA
ncbi:MAG: DUF350 domain-containing protein [Planctomycetota bacterium]